MLLTNFPQDRAANHNKKQVTEVALKWLCLGFGKGWGAEGKCLWWSVSEFCWVLSFDTYCWVSYGNVLACQVLPMG